MKKKKKWERKERGRAGKNKRKNRGVEVNMRTSCLKRALN